MDIKPRPPPLSAIWSKLSPWTATSWPLLGAHVTLVPYEWTVPIIKKESGNLIFVEMVVVTIKYRLTELRPKSLWQRQRKNCQQLSNLVLSGLFFVLVQKIFWPLATFGQISNTVVLSWVHSSPKWSPVVPVGPQPIHSFSDKDKEHKIAVSWMESEETQSTQLTKGKTHKTQFDRTQMVLLLSWLSWHNKNWNNLFRKELTTFYRSQVQSLSTLIFNWLTDWLTDAL